MKVCFLYVILRGNSIRQWNNKERVYRHGNWNELIFSLGIEAED